MSEPGDYNAPDTTIKSVPRDHSLKAAIDNGQNKRPKNVKSEPGDDAPDMTIKSVPRGYSLKAAIDNGQNKRPKNVKSEPGDYIAQGMTINQCQGVIALRQL